MKTTIKEVRIDQLETTECVEYREVWLVLFGFRPVGIRMNDVFNLSWSRYTCAPVSFSGVVVSGELSPSSFDTSDNQNKLLQWHTFLPLPRIKRCTGLLKLGVPANLFLSYITYTNENYYIRSK